MTDHWILLFCILPSINCILTENVESLGCWKESKKSNFVSFENKHHFLTGPYNKRKNAVEKCARVAIDHGFTIFAVQDGGKCLSGANTVKKFDMYGPSNLCRDGKGGLWSNNVYSTKAFHTRSFNSGIDETPWDAYCTRPLDIVVLMDGSGNVNEQTKKRWILIKNFVRKFIRGFDDHSRIGIIQYGENPEIIQDIRKLKSKEALDKVLEKTEFPGGERTLNDALKRAWREQLKETNRTNADKIILATITGDIPYGLYGSSQFLSDHNVRIVVVGIDKYVHYEFLQSVASYRDVGNIFSVNSGQLDDVAPYIYRDICNNMPEYVLATTPTPSKERPIDSLKRKNMTKTKENLNNDESLKSSRTAKSRGEIPAFSKDNYDELDGPVSNHVDLSKELGNTKYKKHLITAVRNGTSKEKIATMVLINPSPDVFLGLTSVEAKAIKNQYNSSEETLEKFNAFLPKVSKKQPVIASESKYVSKSKDHYVPLNFLNNKKKSDDQLEELTSVDINKETNAFKKLDNHNDKESYSEIEAGLNRKFVAMKDKAKLYSVSHSLSKTKNTNEMKMEVKNKNKKPIVSILNEAKSNKTADKLNNKDHHIERNKNRFEHFGKNLNHSMKGLEHHVKEFENKIELEHPTQESGIPIKLFSSQGHDPPDFKNRNGTSLLNSGYLNESKVSDLNIHGVGALSQTLELHTGNGKEHVSYHPPFRITHQSLFTDKLSDRMKMHSMFSNKEEGQKERNKQPLKSSSKKLDDFTNKSFLDSAGKNLADIYLQIHKAERTNLEVPGTVEEFLGKKEIVYKNTNIKTNLIPHLFSSALDSKTMSVNTYHNATNLLGFLHNNVTRKQNINRSQLALTSSNQSIYPTTDGGVIDLIKNTVIARKKFYIDQANNFNPFIVGADYNEGLGFDSQTDELYLSEKRNWNNKHTSIKKTGHGNLLGLKSNLIRKKQNSQKIARFSPKLNQQFQYNTQLIPPASKRHLPKNTINNDLAPKVLSNLHKKTFHSFSIDGLKLYDNDAVIHGNIRIDGSKVNFISEDINRTKTSNNTMYTLIDNHFSDVASENSKVASNEVSTENGIPDDKFKINSVLFTNTSSRKENISENLNHPIKLLKNQVKSPNKQLIQTSNQVKLANIQTEQSKNQVKQTNKQVIIQLNNKVEQSTNRPKQLNNQVEQSSYRTKQSNNQTKKLNNQVQQPTSKKIAEKLNNQVHHQNKTDYLINKTDSLKNKTDSLKNRTDYLKKQNSFQINGPNKTIGINTQINEVINKFEKKLNDSSRLSNTNITKKERNIERLNQLLNTFEKHFKEEAKINNISYHIADNKRNESVSHTFFPKKFYNADIKYPEKKKETLKKNLTNNTLKLLGVKATLKTFDITPKVESSKDKTSKKFLKENNTFKKGDNEIKNFDANIQRYNHNLLGKISMLVNAMKPVMNAHIDFKSQGEEKIGVNKDFSFKIGDPSPTSPLYKPTSTLKTTTRPTTTSTTPTTTVTTTVTTTPFTLQFEYQYNPASGTGFILPNSPIQPNVPNVPISNASVLENLKTVPGFIINNVSGDLTQINNNNNFANLTSTNIAMPSSDGKVYFPGNFEISDKPKQNIPSNIPSSILPYNPSYTSKRNDQVVKGPSIGFHGNAMSQDTFRPLDQMIKKFYKAGEVHQVIDIREPNLNDAEEEFNALANRKGLASVTIAKPLLVNNNQFEVLKLSNGHTINKPIDSEFDSLPIDSEQRIPYSPVPVSQSNNFILNVPLKQSTNIPLKVHKIYYSSLNPGMNFKPGTNYIKPGTQFNTIEDALSEPHEDSVSDYQNRIVGDQLGIAVESQTDIQGENRPALILNEQHGVFHNTSDGFQEQISGQHIEDNRVIGNHMLSHHRVGNNLAGNHVIGHQMAEGHVLSDHIVNGHIVGGHEVPITDNKPLKMIFFQQKYNELDSEKNNAGKFVGPNELIKLQISKENHHGNHHPKVVLFNQVPELHAINNNENNLENHMSQNVISPLVNNSALYPEEEVGNFVSEHQHNDDGLHTNYRHHNKLHHLQALAHALHQQPELKKVHLNLINQENLKLKYHYLGMNTLERKHRLKVKMLDKPVEFENQRRVGLRHLKKGSRYLKGSKRSHNFAHHKRMRQPTLPKIPDSIVLPSMPDFNFNRLSYKPRLFRPIHPLMTSHAAPGSHNIVRHEKKGFISAPRRNERRMKRVLNEKKWAAMQLLNQNINGKFLHGRERPTQSFNKSEKVEYPELPLTNAWTEADFLPKKGPPLFRTNKTLLLYQSPKVKETVAKTLQKILWINALVGRKDAKEGKGEEIHKLHHDNHASFKTYLLHELENYEKNSAKQLDFQNAEQSASPKNIITHNSLHDSKYGNVKKTYYVSKTAGPFEEHNVYHITAKDKLKKPGFTNEITDKSQVRKSESSNYDIMYLGNNGENVPKNIIDETSSDGDLMAFTSQGNINNNAEKRTNQPAGEKTKLPNKVKNLKDMRSLMTPKSTKQLTLEDFPRSFLIKDFKLGDMPLLPVGKSYVLSTPSIGTVTVNIKNDMTPNENKGSNQSRKKNRLFHNSLHRNKLSRYNSNDQNKNDQNDELENIDIKDKNNHKSENEETNRNEVSYSKPKIFLTERNNLVAVPDNVLYGQKYGDDDDDVDSKEKLESEIKSEPTNSLMESGENLPKENIESLENSESKHNKTSVNEAVLTDMVHAVLKNIVNESKIYMMNLINSERASDYVNNFFNRRHETSNFTGVFNENTTISAPILQGIKRINSIAIANKTFNSSAFINNVTMLNKSMQVDTTNKSQVISYNTSFTNASFANITGLDKKNDLGIKDDIYVTTKMNNAFNLTIDKIPNENLKKTFSNNTFMRMTPLEYMLGCTKPLRILYAIDVSDGLGDGFIRKKKWNRLKDFISDINNSLFKDVRSNFMVYNIEPRFMESLDGCDKNTEYFLTADDCLCFTNPFTLSAKAGCSVNGPTQHESVEDWGAKGPRTGRALDIARTVFFKENLNTFKNVIFLISHKQSTDDLKLAEINLKKDGISLVDIELGDRHDLRKKQFIPKQRLYRRSNTEENILDEHKVKVSLKKLQQTLRNIVGRVCKSQTDGDL
ncbi:uncharacterized protein LOC101236314 isoform X1 [Hydra vulgaris]|nr:uncharacterized protein LOC101236314 isoform X2 [Hydra vulgaris]XP_047142348.1 uncharacterized protein LOC101236314 isoform X2 [Hydra vulgaris]